MDTIAQVMTMDIGFGDVVTPHPVLLDYPLLLEGLSEVSILAYSTETVIAEKMHAIIDLADQSSRMKDYYDIHHLLTSFQYDTTILQDAINRTFENRGTPYNADTMFFREDFPDHPQMEIRWTAFLRQAAINSALSFPEVVRWLQDTLNPNRSLDCYAQTYFLFVISIPVSRLQWNPIAPSKRKYICSKIEDVIIITLMTDLG